VILSSMPRIRLKLSHNRQRVVVKNRASEGVGRELHRPPTKKCRLLSVTSLQLERCRLQLKLQDQCSSNLMWTPPPSCLTVSLSQPLSRLYRWEKSTAVGHKEYNKPIKTTLQSQHRRSLQIILNLVLKLKTVRLHNHSIQDLRKKSRAQRCSIPRKGNILLP